MRNASPLVLVAVVALAVVALPTASFAQVPSFQAEVSCDGIFSPGESVALFFELENQTV